MQRGKFRPNLESKQRVKLVKVDYDTDYRADVKAMERAITKNTCLLIGSAPEYPHGLIDDLEAISNIAVEANDAAADAVDDDTDDNDAVDANDTADVQLRSAD